MITLEINQFSWSPDTNTLYAEVSNLKQSFRSIPSEFRVKSTETGIVVDFRFLNLTKNSEGDVLTFKYEGFRPDGRKVNLVLFND